MRVLHAALAALAIAGAASTASAAVIIQPKGVVVNIGGELFEAAATNMINQSGLSLGYVSGVTDFATYLEGNPFHTTDTNGEWLSTGPRSTARITFDLGEIMEIKGFAFWNEDSTSLQTIIASTPTGGGYIGTGNLTQNPAGQAYGATYQRHQTITTRYVTFDLYGCNQAGFARNGCGLGEVAFESTATAPPPGAVPEPATWAMMILGFGGVGATLRRRRRSFATA